VINALDMTGRESVEEARCKRARAPKASPALELLKAIGSPRQYHICDTKRRDHQGRTDGM